MAVYKVTMVIEVNEGHPRKWVADAISECLDLDEDILEIDFEELENYKENCNNKQLEQFNEQILVLSEENEALKEQFKNKKVNKYDFNKN